MLSAATSTWAHHRLHPSVCVQQLPNHWSHFPEIWHLRILQKIIKPLQFLFILDMFNDHAFQDISQNIYRRENCFEQKLYRKIKHIFMSSAFFCVYDSLQDN
jgi:hypothetical protein